MPFNIYLDSKFEGCGLAFTIGRGNELLKHAVDSLRFLVIDKEIRNIQSKAKIHSLSKHTKIKLWSLV